jgi:nucleoside-diphosphate-sugar epimerase
VVVTGGAGFIGARLAKALVERGTLKGPDGSSRPIDQLLLVDSAPPRAPIDARVIPVTGDIASRNLFERIIDPETTSIFHLAAVVSGQAEAEFDVGMRTNVDATRALLEVCRARGHAPRVVFASSVAVYGGEMPPAVSEATPLTPQTSYGMEKAIGELLVNDYSRRGFIDGRSLRLPTIVVRPGRPNAAASGFASGIIREPLNGEDAVCPVDADARIVVASPATAVESFIAAHELPAAALGSNRAIQVPGISVTAGEMAAALERVAGPDVVKRIQWQKDDRIARMVTGWPQAVDATRARSLGFPSDDSVEALIRQYLDEYRR